MAVLSKEAGLLDKMFKLDLNPFSHPGPYLSHFAKEFSPAWKKSLSKVDAIALRKASRASRAAWVAKRRNLDIASGALGGAGGLALLSLIASKKARKKEEAKKKLSHALRTKLAASYWGNTGFDLARRYPKTTITSPQPMGHLKYRSPEKTKADRKAYQLQEKQHRMRALQLLYEKSYNPTILPFTNPAGTGRQLASKSKGGYWDNFLKRFDPSPPKPLSDSFLRTMHLDSPTPSQFTRPVEHMSGKEQRLRQSLPREQRYDTPAPVLPFGGPHPGKFRLPSGWAGMLA